RFGLVGSSVTLIGMMEAQKTRRDNRRNQKKTEEKPVPTVGATLLDSRGAVQGGKLLGPTVTAHQ
ncbi:MAG: hypothetical protein NT089_00455, partial [Planctomycetia bacterium]|nr:hypothetical protein [Planctomycetia bacterium]